MKEKYRFRNVKSRESIQVMFAHIPGKWFATGTKDMAKAVLWAENRLHEDTHPDQRPMTLKEFAKDFFSESDPQRYRHRLERHGKHYEDSYFFKKQSQLNNYILPAHGSYLLGSLTSNMIDDFFIDLVSFRNGRELSPDTKNKILETYSDVMGEAKRQGLIKDNPCDDVSTIQISSEIKRKHITEDELALFFPEDRKRLMYIWKSLQWAVYFMIMKDTGFRPGEISALTKLNYYPEFHGIFTQSSVSSWTHEVKDSIKTTKKGQPFKSGFLTDQTTAYLEELIRRTEGDYIFRLSDGNFIAPNTANKHLRSSAKRAGVDLGERTQYSFRHSFATYYFGRIPELARLLLMGHTQTRTEYLHMTPEQTLRRALAIDGMDEVIKGR